MMMMMMIVVGMLLKTQLVAQNEKVETGVEQKPLDMDLISYYASK